MQAGKINTKAGSWQVNVINRQFLHNKCFIVRYFVFSNREPGIIIEVIKGGLLMKLYLKQQVFSWKDKFYVKDDMGQDRYYVEGEFFSFGKKLHIYDMSGCEAAYLEEKVFTFLPKFYISIGGQQAAEVAKEFTFLKPRYSIHGPGWEVEGNFWEHDFTITGMEGTVAAVHKAWMSWGDSYEIDIPRPQDEVLTLAVVLAIDAVLEADAAGAAGAAGGNG